MNVLEGLFTSRVRAGLLSRLVDRDGNVGSLSALARELGVTPRAVARESRHLECLGLVRRQRVGREDRLLAVKESPLFEAIAHLVHVSQAHDEERPRRDSEVRRHLVAYGAPLAAVGPAESPIGLEEAIVRGLDVCKRDSTLLRVFPLILVKNRRRLDLEALAGTAVEEKLAAPLGMLLELTSTLVDWPVLEQHIARLRDGRRKKMRFFFEPRSKREALCMKTNTPAFARRWGFWLNMRVQSFRSALETMGADV